MNTFQRGLRIIALGLCLSGGSALAAEGVAPLAPKLPLVPNYSGAGVKTNRTQLFTQAEAPNPVLPPGLLPPRERPRLAPREMPLGTPAPLLVPPQPVLPPGAARQPVVLTPPPPPAQPSSYLAWDAESKEYAAKVGEPSAHFTFHLTNVSKEVVLINSVRTSCGCTVAQLPEQPWRLAAGTNGPIQVTVNLAGKSGVIAKSVTVDSTAGVKSLLVKVTIPQATNGPIAGVNMDRMRNMQMAMADRQVVFKGECAKCHADPAKGQMGAQLYAAACSNCHDSPQRASMVPDLKHLNHPTSVEHWRHWIASGRPGSMMPAFAKEQGGPLDDAQIASLVKYLTDTIPTISQTTAAKPLIASPIIAAPPQPTIQ
jgi:cytochrome c553